MEEGIKMTLISKELKNKVDGRCLNFRNFNTEFYDKSIAEAFGVEYINGRFITKEDANQIRRDLDKWKRALK